MTIAERLRRELDRSGLTQREIARRTGLEEATISDLLSGKTRRPRFETVERVVRAIGTTFSAVFDEPRIQLSSADRKLVNECRALFARLLVNDAAQKEIGEPVAVERRIDFEDTFILRDAALPERRDDAHSEVENLPNERIPEEYYRAGARRAYRVRTDSMIGVGILDGATVYVTPSVNAAAADGQIVICRLNNTLYIKRLDLRSNLTSLHSENPRYEPLVVNRVTDHFSMVGIVHLETHRTAR